MIYNPSQKGRGRGKRKERQVEITHSFNSTEITLSVFARSTRPRMGLLVPPWQTGKDALDLWLKTLRVTPPDLDCFTN